MSHFPVLVILPDDIPFDNPHGEIEDKVAELLAPYDENEEMFAEGSRWDWWVIGGRWDGAIRNLAWQELKETCFLCKGTGKRPDMEVENGCNGCAGTGLSSVWPTDPRYHQLERNMLRVKELDPEFSIDHFVVPTGQWCEKARVGWFGMTIPNEDGIEDRGGLYTMEWETAKNKYADNIAVLVDCHV